MPLVPSFRTPLPPQPAGTILNATHGSRERPVVGTAWEIQGFTVQNQAAALGFDKEFALRISGIDIIASLILPNGQKVGSVNLPTPVPCYDTQELEVFLPDDILVVGVPFYYRVQVAYL